VAPSGGFPRKPARTGQTPKARFARLQPVCGVTDGGTIRSWSVL